MREMITKFCDILFNKQIWCELDNTDDGDGCGDDDDDDDDDGDNDDDDNDDSTWLAQSAWCNSITMFMIIVHFLCAYIYWMNTCAYVLKFVCVGVCETCCAYFMEFSVSQIEIRVNDETRRDWKAMSTSSSPIPSSKKKMKQ